MKRFGGFSTATFCTEFRVDAATEVASAVDSLAVDSLAVDSLAVDSLAVDSLADRASNADRPEQNQPVSEITKTFSFLGW